MVLLEVSQLLTQGFILNLQVSAAQGDFIQNPAQPVDVSLHALVESQLIFIPAKVSVIFFFFLSWSQGGRQSSIMDILGISEVANLATFVTSLKYIIHLPFLKKMLEAFGRTKKQITGP